MAELKEARVPDIGDYSDVPVIEVLVKPGDTVARDQGLVTLESDKATMEVPSSVAGVVKDVKVKVGDTVSEGSVVAVIETADAAPAEAAPARAQPDAPAPAPAAGTAPSPASAGASPPQPAPAQGGGGGAAASAAQAGGAVQEARVPDIGDYRDVPVIEVLVKPGDTVAKDQGLVTLESDKATMEVPSPVAGVVKEVKVKLGDTLSEGSVVALIESAQEPPPRAEPAAPQQARRASETATQVEPVVVDARADRIAEASMAGADAGSMPGTRPASAPAAGADRAAAPMGPGQPPVRFEAAAVLPDKVPYASPAVRLFARELGVDLFKVQGTARGGRITKEDVQRFVKAVMAGGGAQAGAGAPATAAAGGGLDLLPWPKVDFAKFGQIEVRPLSRIRKISGANLARNWAMIPHVTQHDEADITELEALRVALNKENERTGVKLTMLAFLMKASVAALKKYPEFNASLDAGGENLTLKKYFHIGFAADTPGGLVVPVVRDVDGKGVIEIARETAELAKKARDGKLGPAEMSGGCFSISSLGGIGGTAFTPIVNAPEVAILGVSKSAIKPVWDGQAFQPRLLLPLSLSYDHRVIDGAAAARFTAYLAQLLGDMRRALL